MDCVAIIKPHIQLHIVHHMITSPGSLSVFLGEGTWVRGYELVTKIWTDACLTLPICQSHYLKLFLSASDLGRSILGHATKCSLNRLSVLPTVFSLSRFCSFFCPPFSHSQALSTQKQSQGKRLLPLFL